MFRRWRTTPSGAGSHQSRRDKRRFIPSLSGSASCLEDRVVLSGAGHVANAVHAAVVHHGHTAGAAGQHGVAAAGTHAATHQGHSATAQSHHGLAAAGTPGAVWGYTAPWSGSPATFSTTTTSHLGTGTVSSDPALGGLSASSDWQHLTVAVTSPGLGGAVSVSTTTQSSTTTTGTTPSNSTPAAPTTTAPASQPSTGTSTPPWWTG